MVGTKISGLTGGPSYCQPGGAGHASLSSTPLVPRSASASRREDTALAAHRTPWHSGEHSGLYKILFPIFACSSLVISARGHTPQASNHSVSLLPTPGHSQGDGRFDAPPDWAERSQRKDDGLSTPPPLALTAQDSVPRQTATHSGGHCAGGYA